MDKEVWMADNLINPVLKIAEKEATKANAFLKTVIKELKSAPFV